MAYIDITGQRFGRLVATKYVGQTADRKALFHFVCDCGGEKITSGRYARSGKAQSCGCFQRQRITEACTTHGSSKTRLYRIWSRMRGRCQRPSSSDYEYYGGRDITVCDDWADFATFQAWATANGYAETLTIDRIDPNGNYEPSNCRWLTIQDQQRNRRPRRRKEAA